MVRLTAPRAAVFALLAFSLFIVSCSKDSDNPAGPGPGSSLELNSGDMPQGGSYSHTFANAGTFGYHCARHSNMLASVTVAGGGADSAVVNITGFAFSPTTTTVKPTGSVRWVNLDNALHTVTSH